jgi:chromosomal replication initiation ATPase DnaA
MLVAADAVRAVLEADHQMSIQEAISDMEELREAVERLRAYHEFEPDKINRRRINAQLRAHAQRVGGES